MVVGDALQRAVRSGQRAGRQREVRDEADTLLGRGIEQRFGFTHRQVVHVLHGHDLGDLLGLVQLVDADLGEPDVADLAVVLQLEQLAHLVGQRPLGVDAVQLEQADPFQAEPAQAHLDLLAQVLRAAEHVPLALVR